MRNNIETLTNPVETNNAELVVSYDLETNTAFVEEVVIEAQSAEPVEIQVPSEVEEVQESVRIDSVEDRLDPIAESVDEENMTTEMDEIDTPVVNNDATNDSVAESSTANAETSKDTEDAVVDNNNADIFEDTSSIPAPGLAPTIMDTDQPASAPVEYKEYYRDLAWASSIDMDGNQSLSGSFYLAAVGEIGHTEHLGSISAQPSQPETVSTCNVALNTKNQHSVGEGSALIVEHDGQQVSVDNIESDPNVSHYYSGPFTLSPNGGDIDLYAKFGERSEINGGGFSVEGDFSIDCTTEDVVIETTTTTAPAPTTTEQPTTTPAPSTTEQPTTTTAPAPSTTEKPIVSTTQMPTTSTTQTVETTVSVPSQQVPERLPETGSEVGVLGAIGSLSVMAGVGLVVIERYTKSKPSAIRTK